MTQLAMQFEPAPSQGPFAEAIAEAEQDLSGLLLPCSVVEGMASSLPGALAHAAEWQRCREQPRDFCDRLMDELDLANRRAEEGLQHIRGMLAELEGVEVEQLDQHLAAREAEEKRMREEARAEKPARASGGKAAKGGGATIGIGRAALSERQRELLAFVRVEENVAIFSSEERVPDWDLLKRIMVALGGTWKTGGKKAPGGFRFPDDLDAAELVRLAKETGEITDPKAAQFFWTSDELADELAAFVAPVATGRYLEPSAGKGALAHALRRQCGELLACSIDCVEPLDENRKALLAAGFSVIGHDFLAVDPPRLWDGCILNPPFSGRADTIHITRAIECVRAGGRVAAIASAGVKYRDDARGRAFRALIESHGGVILDNPEGAFAHAGTMVRTVRVLLTKVSP